MLSVSRQIQPGAAFGTWTGSSRNHDVRPSCAGIWREARKPFFVGGFEQTTNLTTRQETGSPNQGLSVWRQVPAWFACQAFIWLDLAIGPDPPQAEPDAKPKAWSPALGLREHGLPGGHGPGHPPSRMPPPAHHGRLTDHELLTRSTRLDPGCFAHVSLVWLQNSGNQTRDT